ncbi:MAG: class I SAM-dependent methyltransferase [Steroidobacteraceae bacterium]
MPATLSNIRSLPLCAILLGITMAASGLTHAADVYDAAVHHAGRTADDIKRDSLDHPQDVLRAAGIKPGMRVADFLAGDGYYSELVSYIVGPSGHVLLLNDPSFDRWSNNGWEPRLAHDRLPNVEHRRIDLNHVDLPQGSLDAILLVKVYHDLYWVDADKKNWPDIDTSAALDHLVRALKPGGILLLVDHSAKAGSGKSAASSLHRIEEAYARHDFEARGLKVVARSDVLRRPEDARDQISYKGAALGKTDRFVLVFRKGA